MNYNEAGKRIFIRDENCPIRNVVAQIGDKWSILILFSLADGADRFNSLKSRIEGISQRMLTQTLRELERDGFVERTVYPQVPVKVEYKLTELGQGLTKSVWGLVSWANEHLDAIKASRNQYDQEHNENTDNQ